VSALAQTLNNLGTGRVVAIGGVGIGMIAFFIFLTSRLGSPGGMVLLYGNLDPADSGQITAKLESQQIPYELKAGGTQIFVPSEDAPKLRLSLNQAGLTGSGTIGYELFDDANALGTTSFVQRINQVRALEGELSRTIKSIDNVKNARVHIVLPQRELFSRDSKEPSASIVLKLSGRFSKAQVQAVQNLVASSVPGLTTARISIVDDKGNLLARGDASDGDGTASPADADELRNTYEMRMARTIEELIERSVGFGKVRAEVNADMDFDRIVTNSEIYDPNGQVVRSTQTVEEGANSTESENASAITVAENLPNAQNEGLAGGGPSAATSSSRTEETVNFEISKTIKNHIRETGTINKLSVAVLVDGTYTTDADGNAIYQPRSQEELQQFEKLVSSTVGYDKKRGDIIEVVNLKFAIVEGVFAEDEIEPLFGLSKQDYFHVGEIIVLSVIAILVILMVVRPLLMRALEAIPTAAERELMAEKAAPALAGPPESALAAAAGAMPEEEEEDDTLINLAQIEGRVKASSLKKVGEIIDKHPEETVSIIRTWMFAEK